MEEFNREVETIINEIEDNDVLDEVQMRYEPFKKNLAKLLDTKTTEEYFEIFNNIEVIKSYGTSKKELNLFAKENKEFFILNMKIVKMQ